MSSTFGNNIPAVLLPLGSALEPFLSFLFGCLASLKAPHVHPGLPKHGKLSLKTSGRSRVHLWSCLSLIYSHDSKNRVCSPGGQKYS